MDGEGEEYSSDDRLVYNNSLQYKGSFKSGKRDGYGVYYYGKLSMLYFCTFIVIKSMFRIIYNRKPLYL